MVGLWTKSVFSKPDPGSWILIVSHHKLKADNKGGVDETARGREGSGETGAQKLPSFYYAEKGNFFRAQTSPSELEKRKKFLGRTTKQTFDS